ncbi:hypothetical protein PENSPDRAFT_469952 [Peniophora sp. CONT]|nr:hypothetical protein PENSPDRAFT_469952 [Peniophora sp. CONT]
MHLLALLVTAGAVAAQDFTIPSTWRKPNVTQSREDRIAIAQRAINYTNGFYDTGMGRYNFPSNATSDGTFIDHDDAVESARHGASSLRYTAMHDLMAGTTVYQTFVTSALKNAVAATPARPDVTGPPTGTLFGIGM